MAHPNNPSLTPLTASRIAFSRLQLAAALIEADSDPFDSSQPASNVDDPISSLGQPPAGPPKYARDSVIFAPFRKGFGLKPGIAGSGSADFLGVQLPSERARSRASGHVRGDSYFSARSGAKSGGYASGTELESANELEEDGALGEDDRADVEQQPDNGGSDDEDDLSDWGLDKFLTDKAKAKSSRVKKHQYNKLSVSSSIAGNLPTKARSEILIGSGGAPAALDRAAREEMFRQRRETYLAAGPVGASAAAADALRRTEKEAEEARQERMETRSLTLSVLEGRPTHGDTDVGDLTSPIGQGLSRPGSVLDRPRPVLTRSSSASLLVNSQVTSATDKNAVDDVPPRPGSAASVSVLNRRRPSVQLDDQSHFGIARPRAASASSLEMLRLHNPWDELDPRAAAQIAEEGRKRVGESGYESDGGRRNSLFGIAQNTPLPGSTGGGTMSVTDRGHSSDGGLTSTLDAATRVPLPSSSRTGTTTSVLSPEERRRLFDLEPHDLSDPEDEQGNFSNGTNTPGTPAARSRTTSLLGLGPEAEIASAAIFGLGKTGWEMALQIAQSATPPYASPKGSPPATSTPPLPAEAEEDEDEAGCPLAKGRRSSSQKKLRKSFVGKRKSKTASKIVKRKSRATVANVDAGAGGEESDEEDDENGEAEDRVLPLPKKGPLRPIGLHNRAPVTLVMPAPLQDVEKKRQERLAEAEAKAKNRGSVHIPEGFVLHQGTTRGKDSKDRPLSGLIGSGLEGVIGADVGALNIFRPGEARTLHLSGTQMLFRDTLVTREGGDAHQWGLGVWNAEEQKRRMQEEEEEKQRLAEEKARRKAEKKWFRRQRKEMGEELSTSEDDSTEEDEDEKTSLQDVVPPSKFPAGQLYGKSLIDVLEQRQTERKNKARHWKGDDMGLLMPPGGDGASVVSSGSVLTTPDGRIARTRMEAVFGVDELWKRESEQMAIELAQEERRRKALEEEERVRQMMIGSKKANKLKKFRKEWQPQLDEDGLPVRTFKSPMELDKPVQPESEPSGNKEDDSDEDDEGQETKLPARSKTPIEPPRLDVALPSLEDEAKSNSMVKKKRRNGKSPKTERAEQWFRMSGDEEGDSEDSDAESDDDSSEEVEASTAAVPNSPPKLALPEGDDSSDDEVPLAQLKARTPRASMAFPPSPLAQSAGGSSDDDEVPLQQVIANKRAAEIKAWARRTLPLDQNPREDISQSMSFSSAGTASRDAVNDEDDDDVPLGLRHPHAEEHLRAAAERAAQEDDDDDKPLGLSHPQAHLASQATQLQARHAQQHAVLLMMQKAEQAQLFASGGLAPPPSAAPISMPDPSAFQGIELMGVGGPWP